MERITKDKLLSLGFKPWEEGSKNYLLDNHPEFERVQNVWTPSFRITISFNENEMQLVGWHSKGKGNFKRITIDNFNDLSDLYKVIQILDVEYMINEKTIEKIKEL